MKARRQVKGARPLAQRDIDRSFRSVFIASAKSGVEPFEDLSGLQAVGGKRLTFGSQTSTSVVRRWLGVGRRRGQPARTDAATAGPARDRPLLGSALVATVLVAVSAWWLAIDPSTLWADRTLRLLGDAAAAAWPPDVAAAGGASLVGFAATTAAMAVIGTALAFLLALVLVVPAAATIRLGGGSRLARWALRLPLLVLRAVPPPVWAFVAVLVLLPGVLPGALAIAVYNLGVLGRLLAEAVEETDDRPRAGGARRVAAADRRHGAAAGRVRPVRGARARAMGDGHA